MDVTKDPSLQDALEVVSSLFALSSSSDGRWALTQGPAVYTRWRYPHFQPRLWREGSTCFSCCLRPVLSSLWRLPAGVGPPSFLSSALIITPVLSSKAVLQKLIEVMGLCCVFLQSELGSSCTLSKKTNIKAGKFGGGGGGILSIQIEHALISS